MTEMTENIRIPVLQEPVMLTEEAANAAIAAMKAEGLENYNLRIGVTGGGCSGLQYLLDFVEEGKELELDFKYEQCGVTVVVDQVNVQRLSSGEARGIERNRDDHEELAIL